MVDEPKKAERWWQTIPGLLTAIAGIITAITGLVVALNTAGLFGRETNNPSTIHVSKKSLVSSESTRTVPNSISQSPANSSLSAPIDQNTNTATTDIISTNIDKPVRLSSNEIRGVGVGKNVSCYYTFYVNPGLVKIVADAKNKHSGVANAIRVILMDMDAKELLRIDMGNTTIDQRIVESVQINHEQQVLMRVILDEETIDYMVRVEGSAVFSPAP